MLTVVGENKKRYIITAIQGKYILSGQPLHPATANFSKDFCLGEGGLIGSLLGLLIAKREQP